MTLHVFHQTGGVEIVGVRGNQAFKTTPQNLRGHPTDLGHLQFVEVPVEGVLLNNDLDLILHLIEFLGLARNEFS